MPSFQAGFTASDALTTQREHWLLDELWKQTRNKREVILMSMLKCCFKWCNALKHHWQWPKVHKCGFIMAHTEDHRSSLYIPAYSLLQTTQQKPCLTVWSCGGDTMTLWEAARSVSSLIAAVTAGKLCDTSRSSWIFSVTSTRPAASSCLWLVLGQK